MSTRTGGLTLRHRAGAERERYFYWPSAHRWVRVVMAAVLLRFLRVALAFIVAAHCGAVGMRGRPVIDVGVVDSAGRVGTRVTSTSLHAVKESAAATSTNMREALCVMGKGGARAAPRRSARESRNLFETSPPSAAEFSAFLRSGPFTLKCSGEVNERLCQNRDTQRDRGQRGSAQNYGSLVSLTPVVSVTFVTWRPRFGLRSSCSPSPDVLRQATRWKARHRSR
jgi:hypothetical protein